MTDLNLTQKSLLRLNISVLFELLLEGFSLFSKGLKVFDDSNYLDDLFVTEERHTYQC